MKRLLCTLLLAVLCNCALMGAERCRTDQECPSGLVCVAGVRECRPQGGCSGNKDCGLSYFCDTTINRCVEAGKCTEDFQCPVGAICEGGSCVEGCRRFGDCNLGEGCAGGKCVAGACETKADCGFAQYCRESRCAGAPPPLCRDCTEPGECGEGSYCFFDRLAMASMCGISCALDDDCPQGFGCHQIVNNPECTSNRDCASNTCILQENQYWFCLCRQNSHCGYYPCTRGRCEVTGAGCSEDSDCGYASCTEDGSCLISFQCAPLEGNTCFMGDFSGPVGSPCTYTTECLVDGMCLRGDVLPEGYCTRECGFGCPSGSKCVDFEDGTSFCLKECDEDGDCGPSQVCYPEVWVCFVP